MIVILVLLILNLIIQYQDYSIKIGLGAIILYVLYNFLIDVKPWYYFDKMGIKPLKLLEGAENMNYREINSVNNVVILNNKYNMADVYVKICV